MVQKPAKPENGKGKFAFSTSTSDQKILNAHGRLPPAAQPCRIFVEFWNRLSYSSLVDDYRQLMAA
jgi:hypothetical protein